MNREITEEEIEKESRLRYPEWDDNQVARNKKYAWAKGAKWLLSNS